MSNHVFGPDLQARIDALDWADESSVPSLRALRNDPRLLREFVVEQFRQGPLWRQIVEDRLLETARATVDELIAKVEETDG